MNGDAFANAIQIIATLIALVGLAVSFEFSRRGQRLQEQQARDSAAAAAESNREAQAAAKRAAAAAALTIDDLGRIAAALERLAPGPAHPAFQARSLSPVVSWRLEQVATDRFRLTNTGSAAAHDVAVTGAASLDGPSDLRPATGDVSPAGSAGCTVGPGAALLFDARIVPTTADATVTVTWTDSDSGSDAYSDAERRRTWRYPLPA